MTYDHVTKAGNLNDLHKHAILSALTVSLLRVKGGTKLNILDAYAGLEERYLVPHGDPRWEKLSLLADHLMAGNDYPEDLEHWLGRLQSDGYGGMWYPGSSSVLRSALDNQPGSTLLVNDRAAIADSIIHTHRRPALALLPELDLDLDLVFIDPSYTQADDMELALDTLKAVRHRWPEACVALWMPMPPPLPAGFDPGAVANTHILLGMWDESLEGSAMVVWNPPRSSELELSLVQATDFLEKVLHQSTIITRFRGAI